jgi:hypothetical protein
MIFVVDAKPATFEVTTVVVPTDPPTSEVRTFPDTLTVCGTSKFVTARSVIVALFAVRFWVDVFVAVILSANRSVKIPVAASIRSVKIAANVPVATFRFVIVAFSETRFVIVAAAIGPFGRVTDAFDRSRTPVIVVVPPEIFVFPAMFVVPEADRFVNAAFVPLSICNYTLIR